MVGTLNGRNPEEMTAYIVLKDQDAEFQKPAVRNFENNINLIAKLFLISIGFPWWFNCNEKLERHHL